MYFMFGDAIANGVLVIILISICLLLIYKLAIICK